MAVRIVSHADKESVVDSAIKVGPCTVQTHSYIEHTKHGIIKHYVQDKVNGIVALETGN